MKEELTRLVNWRREAVKNVEDLEVALQSAKTELKRIEENLIPDLLHEHGLNEVTMEDGTKIKVGLSYYATIPEALYSQAMDWLSENGHGTLIKKSFEIRYDRTDEEESARTYALLQEHNIPFSLSQKVHPQTLRAFVRDQIEKGESVPYDLLGVSTVSRATIKSPSNT